MQINKNILGRHQYILPTADNYRHKLDIIENQAPICPDVAAQLTARDIHLYPQYDADYAELLQRLAQRLGVCVKNIALTNGSDNALKTILEAYAVPGTKICVPTPTYPHFIEFARSTYAELVTVSIDYKDEINTIYEKISQKLSEIVVNVCYICSPNLPFGYCFTPDLIECLLISFPHTMFIIDEAYIEYGTTPSAVSLIDYNNIVITRTFSKAYGLAGLRIGYIIIKDIDTLRVLINSKNVTNLSIKAALAVMRSIDYYDNQVKDAIKLKEKISTELSCVAHMTAPIYDYNIKGGNFFLIFCRAPLSAVQIFAQYGIIVRDKSAEIPGAVRIALGTERQMDEVLLIIKFLNLNYLLTTRPIIFDMDGTLREGSRGPFYKLSRNFVDPIICTNNCTALPEDFRAQISVETGLNIAEVISPLSYFKSVYPDERPYVVGSVAAKRYFGDYTTYTCVLICGIDINLQDILTIRILYDRGLKVYHTDNNEYVQARFCAEVDCNIDVTLPDIGAYIKLLDIESQYIGKPMLSVPRQNALYIGDSLTTDLLMARKLGRGVTYIHVDNTYTAPTCDLDNMYMIIPSVKSL